MMSAHEFFDFDPEPPWLVDALNGEVISVNSHLEYFSTIDGASSSSAGASLLVTDQNHGTVQTCPSDFSIEMDVDEYVPGPSHTFAPVESRVGRAFERPIDHHFVPVGVSHTVIESPSRQPFTMLSEQHKPWIGTSSTPPMHVAANRLAPAADLFLRAFKKQKFSHYL